MREKYVSHSPADLPEIAEHLLSCYHEKRIFAFFGEMGAGKTTFIKALCKTLNVIDTVSSPTFAILNEYITAEPRQSIYHFDLYRLKSYTELYDIGYEDYFYSSNYCFIEWPEKIQNLLPDDTVEVHITPSEDGSKRTITF